MLTASFEVFSRESVRTLLENRHSNVVIQKWDISCGAAALGTILNYQFDDYVSEVDIAKEMMGRDEYRNNPEMVKNRLGFSLLDLKRYVEGKGYRGVGYGRLDLESIKIKAPIMISVFINGYNHFVVFRGVRGNRVVLADPAWGNRTMTIDRFMSIWMDYPKIGRVGFQVVDDYDPRYQVNRMAPEDMDFVNLR